MFLVIRRKWRLKVVVWCRIFVKVGLGNLRFFISIVMEEVIKGFFFLEL